MFAGGLFVSGMVVPLTALSDGAENSFRRIDTLSQILDTQADASSTIAASVVRMGRYAERQRERRAESGGDAGGIVAAVGGVTGAGGAVWVVRDGF